LNRIPHGEERVFARLRTMLRIAVRTMKPASLILRDAAKTPLLRMRKKCFGFKPL
jgi:hypothetical protein